MWIFLKDAFLSIVDKGGDGSTLLVRARRSGDLERIFPGAEVKVGGGTDYRYRARIDREQVAAAIADLVRNIGYPNFKSAVPDEDRHDAYIDVWRAMYKYQADERRKS